MTIFATESPCIRRSRTNRWRIETGLIAHFGCRVSGEILWQGFAICNLRTRRALARQNRTESSNLSSSAIQSELRRISARSAPKYANNARIPRLLTGKPDHRERTARGRRGHRPPFLQRAPAQSGFKESIRRMQRDQKPMKRRSPGLYSFVQGRFHRNR